MTTLQAPADRVATVDPVTLELVRTGLQAIPDLIEVDITRTAFTPGIYEYKDFAVGIVDAEGKSVALAQRGLPAFLTNALGLAIRDGVEIHGLTGIEEGDVLVTNHAATMGQHLNNVVMYTPIMGRAGRPVAFMAVTVHWIDIGGKVPGSAWGTDNTELAQEGLQLRSVKLYRRGEPVDDIFRIVRYNTRQQEALFGDIAAQHAGCLKGRRLFEGLLARYGEDTVFAAIHQIWASTEAAAYEAVRAVPPGSYRAECFLDDDGVTIGQHLPLNITVHIRDGEFVVDYTEIADQVKGPFNSGHFGGAVTTANIAFKYLFSPEDPSNEGSFAPVRVVIPEGKLLSAREGAAMELYQTPLAAATDVVIAAMAPAAPERVAAGHFGAHGVYGFSGQDALGRYFNFFDTLHGGWGASIHGDGVGPFKTLRHADNRDIPAETVEALYPVVVERCLLRIDSAGPGRHRGGLGIAKTFRATGPCIFNAAFDRLDCPPWGLNGGRSALPQYAEIERADGSRAAVRKTVGIELARGDKVHIYSGGGGGYGPPLERDPESVRRDVALGFVSREAAGRDYGVVLRDDGAVDAAATAALRGKMGPK